MIREVKVKKGFTIIELMLAMSAVAGLMIAVAGLIIQMTNTITRGTTYRDLNAASRTINVDLTKTLNSTSMLEGWDGSVGNEYYREFNGSGAFCTGVVSYLWNTNLSNAQIRYSGQNQPTLRFVKTHDTSKAYCEANASANGGIWERVPKDSTTTEILTEGEINLQIHQIRFSSNNNLKNDISHQMMINIDYVLGTPENGDIRLNKGSRNCEGDVKSNYCAVNKFELTVRTTGQ